MVDTYAYVTEYAPLSAGGVNALAQYRALIASLNPTLWARFDEASGNLINYGSDGNAGTVTGATQGQTGQLGAQEATLLDGADDIAGTFLNANLTATKALTTHRCMFLIKAATLGEGDDGVFYCWGDDGLTSLRFDSLNRLRYRVLTSGTDAYALSDNNQVDFLTAWTLVFVDYDDADSLGLGRKIRLMRATAAAATTLLTLGTDDAGTGTVTVRPEDLLIGNRASTAFTFDGLIDEGARGAELWSPAATPADLTLPDSIRTLVFGL